MGIRLLIFLDDILIIADSPERAAEHTEIVIRVLESLGFVIKKKKSILKPTQTIPFLGFIVNSIKMLLLLPEEKLQKLKSSALSLLENVPTAREMLDRNMVISAIHVPGKWNLIADGKFRIFHDSIEWMLDHNLFKQVTKHLGLPVVDLFASRVNHQMPEFVLEARTRGNSNRCFQYPLGPSAELPVSSFLPYTDLPKESNAGAGRLHSHCSSMEEMAMVSSTPIHAYRASSAIASGSENPETPRDRQDSPPCCQKKFYLAIWKISGKACKTKALWRKCQKFYPPGEATQSSNMKVLGKPGVAGVVKKRLILFLQL